ncbi:MAG: hypothetical protein JO138_11575 [Acidobacteriaceae bacterium]|nr:hypothetical protein [Acidobacteriaceae bacterium]
MVAVSVSRALRAGEMLSVQHEQDIEPSLTMQAWRIYDLYCHPIRNETDPRIIGLICHLYPPTWIRGEGQLVAASQFDIFLRDGLHNVLPISADSLRRLLARLSFSAVL